jgi:hypothetical protein
MKDQEKVEFDCSRKCQHALEECKTSGQGRDECEERYDQCLSICAYA